MKPASGARKAGIENSVLVRIQSNWLSNVIHDLANPLFAARGYLRMLLEEKNNPLTESQHHYATTALENIDKLTALTQELNDLPGKNGVALEVVDFRDLFQQVLGEARNAFPGENIRFVEQISSASVATIGDPGKLADAVQRLLRAAIEFIEFTGIVQIKVREESKRILVELWATPGPAGRKTKPVPDVSDASRIWRLHGGHCSLSQIAEGGCVINCELPVVRLEEC